MSLFNITTSTTTTTNASNIATVQITTTVCGKQCLCFDNNGNLSGIILGFCYPGRLDKFLIVKLIKILVGTLY